MPVPGDEVEDSGDDRLDSDPSVCGDLLFSSSVISLACSLGCVDGGMSSLVRFEGGENAAAAMGAECAAAASDSAAERAATPPIPPMLPLPLLFRIKLLGK